MRRGGRGENASNGKDDKHDEAASGTRRHLEVSSTPSDGDLSQKPGPENSPTKGERPAFARRPWGGEIRYVDMCAEESWRYAGRVL